MEILVWGAGAIGGTVAAHLARAGHALTLVDCAADHVAAVNADGLRITGPIAEFAVRVPALLPGEVRGRFETALLATKAQDTAGAARALEPSLSRAGCVVSLQNGLNELVLEQILGRERTVGAFVNFGADYIAPGTIHYAGRGAVVLGEVDGHLTPRIQALQRVFLDFDAGASVTANIWGYLWGKEAYGAMLFATALTNDSIADALADPRYRGLYVALGTEVLAVAQARGVVPEAFDGFDPRAFLPGTPRVVSESCLNELVAFNRRSAKTHSGIWRDLAVRKRRTEVDAQLGAIVSLGREAGAPTPLTARLVELIHDVEDGGRQQSPATLDLLNACL